MSVPPSFLPSSLRLTFTSLRLGTWNTCNCKWTTRRRRRRRRRRPRPRRKFIRGFGARFVDGKTRRKGRRGQTEDMTFGFLPPSLSLQKCQNRHKLGCVNSTQPPRPEAENAGSRNLALAFFGHICTSWENAIMREVEWRVLGVGSRYCMKRRGRARAAYITSLRIPITRARCCPRAHLL